MNLIGHLACAHARDSNVRLGSMLPDLLRLFVRKPRIGAIVDCWEERQEPGCRIAHLIEGIHFHHLVDSRFHRAPLFRDHSVALRIELERASSLPGLKRFFAAHVWLELVLDHYLLTDDPGLADDFYGLLGGGGQGLLAEFLDAHPEADGAGMRAFCAKLVANRFLDAYIHHGGIAGRVNRMLVSMRQRSLTEPEVEAIVSYCVGGADSLREELAQFVMEMRREAGRIDAGPVLGRNAGGEGVLHLAPSTENLGEVF